MFDLPHSELEIDTITGEAGRDMMRYGARDLKAKQRRAGARDHHCGVSSGARVRPAPQASAVWSVRAVRLSDREGGRVSCGSEAVASGEEAPTWLDSTLR